MDYTFECPQTRKSLNHLRECMNVYDTGTEEYMLAQKAFAYICNRIRVGQKTDAENKRSYN